MHGDELTGLAALTTPPPTQQVNNNESLGRDEFLRLLIVQLQNQDPLSPEDPAKFVSELTQFSNLEQLIAIREGVEGSSSGAERGVLDAASLIGREVLAIGDQIEIGAAGTGRVTFDLPRNANSGSVQILDANGQLLTTQTLTPTELLAGRHHLELGFDPGSGIGAGVYQYRVEAIAGGDTITPISYVAGTATGARAVGLDGDVKVLIGEIEVALEDAVEVRGSR